MNNEKFDDVYNSLTDGQKEKFDKMLNDINVLHDLFILAHPEVEKNIKYNFKIKNSLLADEDLINSILRKFDNNLGDEGTRLILSHNEALVVYTILRNYKLDVFKNDIDLELGIDYAMLQKGLKERINNEYTDTSSE